MLIAYKRLQLGKSIDDNIDLTIKDNREDEQALLVQKNVSASVESGLVFYSALFTFTMLAWRESWDFLVSADIVSVLLDARPFVLTRICIVSFLRSVDVFISASLCGQ